MNDVNSTILQEYASVSSASVAFYNTPSPFNSDEDSIEARVMLISTLGHLMEICDGKVKRIQEVPFKSVHKMIIHHKYEPFHRFLIVLWEDKASSLDYSDLQILQEWEFIKDAAIYDADGAGKPTLYLTKLSGDIFTVDPVDSIQISEPETEKGQRVIADALKNNLKDIVWKSKSVELELRRKEEFLSKKLSEFNFSLHGDTEHRNIKQSIGSSCNREDSRLDLSKISVDGLCQSSEETTKIHPLKVISTRCRILQDKWIICASIANKSDRYLIQNLQLTLHILNGEKSLQFCTKLLKITRRGFRSCATGNATEDPIVEDVFPLSLRPERKAFFFAICSLPDFYDDNVSCSGLLSYKVAGLRPSDMNYSQQNTLYSPLQTVTLSPATINSSCVNLKSGNIRSGFSFDLLALIAASEVSKFAVRSTMAPLRKLDQLFPEDFLMKIPELNNVYCFLCNSAHPLNYALLLCKQISANDFHFTSYTRDNKQTLLLAKTILEAMPQNAYLDVVEESIDIEGSCLKQLNNKLRECVSYVTDLKNFGCGDDEGGGAIVSVKRNMKDGFEFKAKDYNEWRMKLLIQQIELDRLASSLYAD